MIDGRAHHAVLDAIVTRGAAPTVAELAAALDVSEDDAAAALRRLDDGHGLVLHPGTLEVYLAHPFSLSPTATWVRAGERGWWAPCLWCAFGIHALIGGDATVHARVAGEDEPVEIALPALRDDLVAHFAMPPRRAWDHVVHFCAMLLPFRGAREIDAWCARHRLPRGEVLPLAQLYALARRWYGGHLARDWRKHTGAEAAAIFAEVGLTGAFWQLDTAAARF